MSSETEEERRDVVQSDPAITTDPNAVTTTSPPVVQERVVTQQPVVREPVAAATPPAGNQRRESTVVRRNTNVGAIIAMLIGILVLVFGIYLVFSRVFPYLPYPYSVFAILILGVILIAVGGSLVSRTKTI